MLIEKELANKIKDFFQEEKNLSPDYTLWLEKTVNPEYGDLTTNCALRFSKILKENPLSLAQALKLFLERSFLSAENLFEIKVEKPGFLNFYLKSASYAQNLCFLITAEKTELLAPIKNRKKILLEYVSANPTGDLHMGHGRGAVIGSTLAQIFQAIGHQVLTEYYLNDAGEQIRQLGLSAWKIYQKEPYQAEELAYPAELISSYLEQIDLEQTKNSSSGSNLTLEELTAKLKEKIISKQKQVLKDLRVEFTNWVSEEAEIHKTGLIEETIRSLQKQGLTYEKDGALWLASSKFGDERDRVLLKSEERRATYLLGDLAYHRLKFQKANHLIDLFGADHQGQEKSLKLTLDKLASPEEKKLQNLEILFVQFVSLKEDNQEFKMSKRAGKLIKVEEVLAKVGADAFRFLLLLSGGNNRLVFDLDLAKQQDEQNPVFYVQYSHTRASSILRNALEKSLSDKEPFCSEKELEAFLAKPENLEVLLEEKELTPRELKVSKELITALSSFEKTVYTAAETLNPAGLTHYLINLAGLFHSFYSSCWVIEASPKKKQLSLARLLLVKAYKKIVAEALALLLVSAPERM